MRLYGDWGNGARFFYLVVYIKLKFIFYGINTTVTINKKSTHFLFKSKLIGLKFF